MNEKQHQKNLSLIRKGFIELFLAVIEYQFRKKG